MTEIRESKWIVHVKQKCTKRLYTDTHLLPLSPRFQDAQYVRTSTMLYRENPSGAGLNSSVNVEVNSSEYLVGMSSGVRISERSNHVPKSGPNFSIRRFE